MAKERFIDEQLRSEGDIRSGFQIDRDRILYATSFARLAEVTQVISADHGYVFHNRLTHSLKVAQVARRLAEYLSSIQGSEIAAAGGLDPDAVEAAGLAHDLGHPPFGHIAEEELHEVMMEIGKTNDIKTDGYEGNAQSFRLVTKLSVGDAVKKQDLTPIRMGLNLNRRTLNGILKYPWMAGTNSEKKNKWGAYESEKDYFDFAREEFSFGTKIKSLEAEIMDWADDITYAVHDVTDFYCAGKIPLERFAEENQVELTNFYGEVFGRPGNEKLKAKESDYKAAFERICKRVYANSIKSRYSGTTSERSDVWQMMTVLITRFFGGIRVIKKPINNQPLVEIEQDTEDEIAMLKQLTWHYVIMRSDLASVQHGQRFMIKSVFQILFAEAERRNTTLFTPPYNLLIEEDDPAKRLRIVADYVSGMTEAELIRLFQKLTGQKLQPLFPY